MINNHHKKLIDVHSLKFRLFESFAVFAIFIMLMIWFLQIFFLHSYYDSMKEKETAKLVSTIIASYGTELFLPLLESISDTGEFFIFVEDSEGNNVNYSSTSPPPPRFAEGFNNFKNDFLISGDKFTSTYIQSPSKAIRYFLYATYLEPDNPNSEILFLISPLYPMQSTLQIIIDQLKYITIIALLISAILAMFMANRISRPLRYLTQSTKLLAQGKFGTEFKSDYFTEIKDLASTLTYTSKELEKMDSHQKSLIANVSHDLRTPLTMVKSYAEMIRDISGDNPEKRNQHLQVIIDEADRLNLLVTDILSLSKLQTGSAFIEKKPISMKTLTESVLQSYSLLKEQDCYDIKLECKRDIFIEGDESKIKQVISNLLLNAIKFCGDDHVIILKIEKVGSRMHFSVTDHGNGISKDEIDHVWDRYYRASNNLGRPSSGSGLGLAIVKEIVLLHGGIYGVQSTPGVGTTFWFEI